VFLGLTAAGWSAVAAWVTVVVYVLLAVYAIKQVREARRSREDQTRPFVTVGFTPEFLSHLAIVNAGHTVAKNVRIGFDPPLSSTISRPWEFESSPALNAGLPTLVPGREYRILFDTMIERLNDTCTLPRRYDVTVTYEGPQGSKGRKYKDMYALDLAVFNGLRPPDEGLADISRTLKAIDTRLGHWTYSLDGIRIYNVDVERYERQRGFVMQQRRLRRGKTQEPKGRLRQTAELAWLAWQDTRQPR